MSKRKKNDPNPDDDDEEEEDLRGKSRQQQPQKVYDFHKKTVEVYPERLRELNRQFLASISTQVTSEPYSVLVGNCLDYVRQYFNYEDDLLKHSPWLAARLKQSRTDIVNCLQETIDVYEALARQDFDRLFENKSQASENQSIISNNRSDSSILATPSVVTFRLPTVATTTTSSSAPSVQPSKSVTTTADSTPSTPFSFTIPTSTASPTKTSTTNTTPFAFSIPSTGFGTSTFSSPTTDKATTSFTPSKFSFNPIPSNPMADQPVAPVTGDDNEDEPSEPPQPEKVDHEADAKLTYRCRMGVNKSGKLIKRGPVQVVLKETNGKAQLIVRSDDSLGRLFLNIIWSKMIELKKNSTKDLTFVCRLNPAMPEISEGEFVTILFRFDNEADRNDAFEKLEKERN